MDRAVPEHKYVDIGDGLKVHYHEAPGHEAPGHEAPGHEAPERQGAGQVVLFLHGSGPGASGWSNFRRNYPAFAEAGFRALVPDTLGYGYSSKPDNLDYELDFLVGGVERFLKGLGVTSCAIVGNSHGGAMAIRLARRRPDLVTKLVLMAPGGLEERETYMKMEGIRTMMKVFLAPDGITREGMRRVFGLQLFDPAILTEEILDERCAIAPLQPKRVLTSMHVPNLVPDLAELRCPVFALWGVNDKFCPMSGAVTIATHCMGAGGKGARVMLLNGCGHWVMVEHTALFNRLSIDFLREAS